MARYIRPVEGVHINRVGFFIFGYLRARVIKQDFNLFELLEVICTDSCWLPFELTQFLLTAVRDKFRTLSFLSDKVLLAFQAIMRV